MADNKPLIYTTVWASLRASVLSGSRQTQEDLLSDFMSMKSTDQQNTSLATDLRIAAALEKGHEGASWVIEMSYVWGRLCGCAHK